MPFLPHHCGELDGTDAAALYRQPQQQRHGFGWLFSESVSTQRQGHCSRSGWVVSALGLGGWSRLSAWVGGLGENQETLI